LIEAVLLQNYAVSCSLGIAPISLHLNIDDSSSVFEHYGLLEEVQPYDFDDWKLRLIMADLKRKEKIRKQNEKWNEREARKKTIEVDDLVFMRMYRQSSTVSRKISKFFDIYSGPYYVSNVINGKIAELIDPVTGRSVGCQSFERLKLWSPSPECKLKWQQMSWQYAHRYRDDAIANQNAVDKEQCATEEYHISLIACLMVDPLLRYCAEICQTER
jgi:hypothetical protein